MSHLPISLEELYEEYIFTRKIDISLDQFLILASFFPALLVISTDGKVDEEEWRYVDSLVHSLCNSLDTKRLSIQEVKELKNVFHTELRYLQRNFDTWERKFTKALKKYLHDHPVYQSLVSEHIYQSASVSEGICEKEKTMIEYLLKELGMD